MCGIVRAAGKEFRYCQADMAVGRDDCSDATEEVVI